MPCGDTAVPRSEPTPGLPSDSLEGSEAAREILQEVWEHLKSPGFAVRLWTGELWDSKPPGKVGFTLIVRSPAAVRLMFSHAGALSFGEAFAFGLVDMEGAMSEIFEPLEQVMRLELPWGKRLRMATLLGQIPRVTLPQHGTFSGFNGIAPPRSRERHQEAINYHYNHPVEFWRAWLDDTLSYSCAYFDSENMPLMAAQEAKLDYICHKLRLQPGMRVLDLGCGWGAWILHAARHYGVQAVGVTLSPRQAEVARDRIRQAGLESQCQVEIANFLDFTPTQPFDRIASIGSVEHVPAELFDDYFAHAHQLLQPGGQLLNHGITRSPTVPDRPGDSFMDKYVFPDHHLATVGRTVAAAESAGFEVRDVESLREHYTLTLEHWQTRLESSQAEVIRWSDPLTHRVFRLYLAGSAHEFRIGRLGLHQTLLVKSAGGVSGLPWRRADWYAGED